MILTIIWDHLIKKLLIATYTRLNGSIVKCGFVKIVRVVFLEVGDSLRHGVS